MSPANRSTRLPQLHLTKIRAQAAPPGMDLAHRLTAIGHGCVVHDAYRVAKLTQLAPDLQSRVLDGTLTLAERHLRVALRSADCLECSIVAVAPVQLAAGPPHWA